MYGRRIDVPRCGTAAAAAAPSVVRPLFLTPWQVLFVVVGDEPLRSRVLLSGG